MSIYENKQLDKLREDCRSDKIAETEILNNAGKVEIWFSLKNQHFLA